MDVINSTNSLHEILDRLDDGIVVVDREGVTRFANVAAETMLRISRADLVGRPFSFELSAGRTSEIALPGEESCRLEMKTDPITWEEEAAHLVTLRVLERERRAAYVQDSEQHLQAIIDHYRDAILIVEGDGTVRFANPAAARLLGREVGELIDTNFGIPIMGTDLAEVDIPGAEIRTAEMQVVPLDWAGGSFNLVALRDITGRRKAEASARELRAELTHASRLSTVGNVATGLAHELNQPLSAINSYVQASIRMLRAGEENIEEVIGDLEKVTRQITRASDIINWLRELVSKQERNAVEVDLNAVLAEVAGYLENDIKGHGSTLDLRLATSLPTVIADKVQIQQVVLNIMRNSLEAKSERAGGIHRITVSSSSPSDGFVQVVIGDNGPGIPDEIRDDVFSSFFTTKKEGLGFGLSVSKSIIESHGGRIWVHPAPGVGAAFMFTLPVCGQEAA